MGFLSEKENSGLSMFQSNYESEEKIYIAKMMSKKLQTLDEVNEKIDEVYSEGLVPSF